MTLHQAIASPGCGCDRQDMLHALISIDEALARIAAHASPVSRTEAVQAGSALGRTLALPVRSRSMAPAFDNAAMDGYAIETSALTGAGPWVLPVVARICGVFRTPRDDGLQGRVILARGLAKIGVEGVIADSQGEIVRTGIFILLLPEATALDQFAARGAAKDTVRRCHGVAAGDGFDRDVEVEGQG